MGRTLEEKISSLVLTAIILSGVTAYALLNNRIYFADESLLMPLGARTGLQCLYAVL